MRVLLTMARFMSWSPIVFVGSCFASSSKEAFCLMQDHKWKRKITKSEEHGCHLYLTSCSLHIEHHKKSRTLIMLTEFGIPQVMNWHHMEACAWRHSHETGVCRHQLKILVISQNKTRLVIALICTQTYIFTITYYFLLLLIHTCSFYFFASLHMSSLLLFIASYSFLLLLKPSYEPSITRVYKQHLVI